MTSINSLYRNSEHAWYMIKELQDQLDEIDDSHVQYETLQLELTSWQQKANDADKLVNKIENELPEYYDISLR